MAVEHTQNRAKPAGQTRGWLKRNFKELIVIIIALVAVFAGLVAFLETQASNQYATTVRQGQALAMDALGHEVSSHQKENYDFYLYTTWKEWNKRLDRAQGGDEELATRSEHIAALISPLTPLLDETQPYFVPETETEDQYVNLGAYHVDTNLLQTTELLEQRAFAIETANIWNRKADGYVTILTVIAVALFLYGLSSTIEGTMRYLFASVGTLLVGIAMLATVTLAVRPVPDVPAEAITQYAQGLGLSYNGEYGAATEAFDAALQAYPHYSKAYYERGNAHYWLGDYAAAAADYQQAIEHGQDDKITYAELGWAYYLLGDYAASLEASRHAQELDPELLPVVMNIATALLASGETEAAMEQYEHALSIAANPNASVPASWNHRYLRWAVQDLDRLLAALEGQTGFEAEPDLSHVGDRAALQAAAEAARLRVKEGTVSIEAAGRPMLEPTGTTLSSLSFARYIGRGGEVVGQGDTFARGGLSVVVTLSFDNLPQAAIVSRRVTREWADQPGWTEDLPTMGEDLIWDGEPQGTWQHVMKAPWPGDRGLRPGRYFVEYYVNGHLAQSGSFLVPEDEKSIIGPIVFATECSSGSIPVGAAGLFPADLDTIYGIVSHSGVLLGTTVYEKWYRDGELYYQRETDDINGWATYCFTLDNVPSGNYRLDVYQEGQEAPLQSAGFQVLEPDDYLQAIGREPDDPLFHLDLGDAYAEADRYQEAAARYEQAIALDPQCARCYHHWWAILDEQGHYEQAIQELQKAIELNPKEYEYLTDLGQTYFAVGDEEQSVAAYRKVVQANPAWGYNAWANDLYDREQYEEAVTRYLQSIELNPLDEVVHTNLGGVYYQLGEYDKAGAAFEQAVTLDPGYAWAYNRWGDTLYAQERYAEAVQKYQQASELNLSRALYHSNLGWAYFQMGEYVRAKSSFQRAVELAPGDAVHHSNLGYVHLELDEYDLAEVAFEQAVTIDPGYAWAYNQWGNTLYEQERYAQAVEKYRQAAELAPDTALYQFNLGITHYLLGEYNPAVTALQRAIEIDPEYASAHNIWGHILYDQGEFLEAAAKYGQAAALLPEKAVYHYNLGLAYYQLQENQKAIAEFEMAIDLAAAEGDEALRQDAEEMLDKLQ